MILDGDFCRKFNKVENAYIAVKFVLNLDVNPEIKSRTDSNEGIGSIIKILEDNNKLEDTIIIFSIDNGGVPYAGALNYPLRHSIYNRTVRSLQLLSALLNWLKPVYCRCRATLDTVQDFLIKLGIKPRMHLWEISIFSLNNVIVRPTKIMNRTDKNWAQF